MSVAITYLTLVGKISGVYMNSVLKEALTPNFPKREKTVATICKAGNSGTFTEKKYN